MAVHRRPLHPRTHLALAVVRLLGQTYWAMALQSAAIRAAIQSSRVEPIDFQRWFANMLIVRKGIADLDDPLSVAFLSNYF